jgi:hypothetical protein
MSTRRSISANAVHSTQLSAHASNNAINIHVPTFDGDSELVEFFFEQIDDLIKVNNWSNDHAVLFLKSKLSGAALKFYIQSPEFKNRPDFRVIKSKFCSFFAPSSHNVNYDFNSLKLEANESIVSFAHRLDVSFRKLYPNLDNEAALEQIKIVKFIDAMPYEIKVKLYELKSSSFNENVLKAENLINCHALAASSKFAMNTNVNNSSIIEKLNAMEVMIQGLQSERQERVNFADTADNRALSDERSRTPARRPMPSDRRTLRSRPKQIRCFYCHKLGHVEARCYRKRNRTNNGFPRVRRSRGEDQQCANNSNLDHNATPFLPNRNNVSGN